MKYLEVFLLCLAGCGWHPPTSTAAEAELANHQKVCTAAGETIKVRSEMGGEPCWLTELRLDMHTKTDPDCKAYWGDAAVNLGCAPEKDGGTDGSD